MVLIIGLAMTVIIIDQVSKFYLQSIMALYDSIAIIPDVFHLTMVHNYGAAFGILQHQTWFFILIAILLIAVVGYFIPKIPYNNRIYLWSAGLLVGGALGNLIDRIRLGYVIDFFDFRVWPVFNMADMAIVTGVGLFILAMATSQTGEQKG